MNVTLKEYKRFIRPMVKRIYKKVLRKGLTVAEELLAGDLLIEIVENDFEFEKLKCILNNITDLQKEIFNQLGILKETEKASAFLNSRF